MQKKSLAIALIGYGKMGKAIEAIALSRGHHIVLTINSSTTENFTTDNLQKADVAIEFSNPHHAANNIKKCLDASVPVLSGSTGWLAEEESVRDYCTQRNGCLLYASNFSIGVNLFFALNKKLAHLMNQRGYRCSIEEIHHTEKKDAPSGTAITLAEGILHENAQYERWVAGAATVSTALPIESIRQDPAPGTHTIRYDSAADSISICHTAHNRTGFAEGAVMAA
jgi:4-hydroxy-tetrahydrodipicolinate reductase